jgi:hypothetical protein
VIQIISSPPWMLISQKLFPTLSWSVCYEFCKKAALANGLEDFCPQAGRAESLKIRIARHPGAPMLKSHGHMLGIGYQLALGIHDTTEFLNQFPVIFACVNPLAILQCCQGVDHSKRLMQGCGGKRKTRMRNDADEGNSDKSRQGKGL